MPRFAPRRIPLPRAFLPLRHGVFRSLWLATLASNIGGWMQNTGAGWLMTSLDPSPMMVSLVQAASMLPVFLLALPAGALADIIDRRLFLIGAQAWILAMALILTALTMTGNIGAWGLLALTFAIGAGSAMNFPAWAATTNELVPREDLVGAIALNGIGFNLARALGPAIGGFAIAWAGPEAAFALNAVAFLVLILALLLWKRREAPGGGPKEHLVSAMRAGLRFVSASPAMRAAILRACTFFLFSAAVWGLLPLFVRQQLGLGPQAFGLMLGVMGGSAVAAGFALPALRGRLDRSGMVLWASLIGAVSMALLAVAQHWALAALGMLLYGASWIAAGSTLAAAAQLAAPGWVRARAIAIYQLSFFGVMAAGAALAGWLGGRFGVPLALGAAAVGAAIAAVLVRRWRIDSVAVAQTPATVAAIPQPEAPADELRPVLGERSGRVLEVVRYRIDPAERAAFLAAMQEVRRVRLRSGAEDWRLCEDVAHPERWVELWAVASWTEHLREAARLTDSDHAALARAAALHRGEPPEAARFIQVEP
ncbi:MFS transporter [Siccirubricoccus deserti]|uniref:MFS transporter n=1 Tax=Siccirubricoccus deserti TaxID=2013562 RepID=A0A9X0UD91_9PROT|nr:MFS transporter [Siccirubricoccus deserti]MBC4015313.1 MFS transporter [Siccirubricoccus deserti]GGC40681.1 MFS transporter [Siccirubricoccus deserti]